MARVISIANQKGGVGKTTTTVNLAVALAQLHSRVLAIDLDPQGALSASLGRDGHALTETVYHALITPGFALSRIIYPAQPYLDLVPANVELEAAEVELVGEIRREYILRRLLQPIQAIYDFVLIDCPPSLGVLTINAFCASDQVLVPMQCEYLAMRGIRLLLDAIAKVRARLNPQLDLAGILPTMYATGTIHAREVVNEVRAAFGDKVFDIVVPKSIRFAESSLASQSLLEYDRSHKGGEAYRQLAMRLTGQSEGRQSVAV
jgi:chromosome partitioning protein